MKHAKRSSRIRSNNSLQFRRAHQQRNRPQSESLGSFGTFARRRLHDARTISPALLLWLTSALFSEANAQSFAAAGGYVPYPPTNITTTETDKIAGDIFFGGLGIALILSLLLCCGAAIEIYLKDRDTSTEQLKQDAEEGTELIQLQQ